MFGNSRGIVKVNKITTMSKITLAAKVLVIGKPLIIANELESEKFCAIVSL